GPKVKVPLGPSVTEIHGLSGSACAEPSGVSRRRTLHRTDSEHQGSSLTGTPRRGDWGAQAAGEETKGGAVRGVHLAVGLVGLVGFLATGQYMDLAHDHLRGMDDARRLLFRSTHIYLLFGSLLNLALGLYAAPSAGWRRWVRGVGSLLVLAAPGLAAAA